MTIELPFITASLNELFSMHYRTRANYTKETKEDVAWRVKTLKNKPKEFPLDVKIQVIAGDKRKRDCDNHTGKALLDGLVLGGVLPDDNTDYVRSVTISVTYGEKDKTIITLE